MRGKKGTNGEGKYAANLLLTFRVTAEEKARLEQQADMAGLSVERQERALELLVSAIEHLGVPGHDSEESQTGNRR